MMKRGRLAVALISVAAATAGLVAVEAGASRPAAESTPLRSAHLGSSDPTDPATVSTPDVSPGVNCPGCPPDWGSDPSGSAS